MTTPSSPRSTPDGRCRGLSSRPSVDVDDLAGIGVACGGALSRWQAETVIVAHNIVSARRMRRERGWIPDVVSHLVQLQTRAITQAADGHSAPE